MTADDRLRAVVAGSRSGILATVDADGTPQLSNIYYLSDPDATVIRFSTTTDRRKGRNLQGRPRAALHVAGDNFLNFAVVEGVVRLHIPRTSDDGAVAELREVHSALGTAVAESGFGEEMLAARRMVVRIEVERIYGQLIDRQPRI